MSGTQDVYVKLAHFTVREFLAFDLILQGYERRLTGSHTSSDHCRWWPPDPLCETALTLGVKTNNRDIAELLMRHGATVSPSSPDTVGTPLLYAVRDQKSDLTNTLLDKGADQNQRGTIVKKEKPSFPLLVSAESGIPAIIDSLLKADSKLNDQDSRSFSVLHVAAACRTLDRLNSLLHKHGADMNARLLNGSLPIHSAASSGTPENLVILLDLARTPTLRTTMVACPCIGQQTVATGRRSKLS
ncbi:ankyrin repeat-containing domain protein [Aspergillus taichungensis]|uniref:Ankyrin repeat-containing domain protein n=1 Tax=Aspergillus taichungensis TaxID=482145 RepID=A0A2J5HG62_9EURO|nr:ankyrin repeat-containing domain protein [Aspergillus taichungensis]